MRDLSNKEFILECEKNQRELENAVMGVLKKPGQDVPYNFIHMAEKSLRETGEYDLNDIVLKYKTEKVLVHDTCDIEDIEEYENHAGPFESKVLNGNKYEITMICDLNEVVIEGTGALFDIYTTTEAAIIWGLNESTVRKAIQKGKFRLGIDYRKAGRITLITKYSMTRVYGEPKTK